MTEISIKSLNEMELFAGKLAKEIAPGAIFFLNGDLGSGKTTFVQAFSKALGVNEPVKSPTFIIHSEYFANNLKIHHLDLYRLNTPHELDELKISNLTDGDSYIFIEWAEKFENELADLFKDTKKYKLDFEFISENERLIKIYENSTHPSVDAANFQ